MITNELLEEIWQIKEELARKADYDIERLCDQLREYTEKNPLPGLVYRTPEELQGPPLVADSSASSVAERAGDYPGEL